MDLESIKEEILNVIKGCNDPIVVSLRPLLTMLFSLVDDSNKQIAELKKQNKDLKDELTNIRFLLEQQFLNPKSRLL